MWGIGIITCPALGQLAYELQEKGKRMKALQLTTIAALPGSGGGCMSALEPERMEAKKPETMTARELMADLLDWPSIVFLDEEPGC